MLVEFNPMGYGGRGWVEVNPMVKRVDGS